MWRKRITTESINGYFAEWMVDKASHWNTGPFAELLNLGTLSNERAFEKATQYINRKAALDANAEFIGRLEHNKFGEAEVILRKIEQLAEEAEK